MHYKIISMLNCLILKLGIFVFPFKQGLHGYIYQYCHEMTCTILANVLDELNVV